MIRRIKRIRRSKRFKYNFELGTNPMVKRTYRYSSGNDTVDDIFHESVACLNTVKEVIDIFFDFIT
ncbi:MAG TPA: hypothetical protein PLK90_08325 [Clostridiales bacterium]|nr:hypothetical protein [Clostridiales bacterium]HQP70387.1 hypothetical protein [Clostridiales bacterium]